MKRYFGGNCKYNMKLIIINSHLTAARVSSSAQMFDLFSFKLESRPKKKKKGME